MAQPNIWFKTLNELDLAVNKDSIEMVNILVEYGEIDRREQYPYADNNPELVIHFKGKPQAPKDCYFDKPREVIRLFLALSEGRAEDGPFLSLIDIDREMVLLDPRKILFVEAPSDVIEEGWKDMMREDSEGTQTSPASRHLDPVSPGLRKRSRHSHARRPKMPK